MASGKLLPATDRETGRYIVTATHTSGPSSYSSGGFTVTLGDLMEIEEVLVQLRNQDNAKRIKYSPSGNQVTIQIYTISADTSTGAISATEDADGTDESDLTFDIFAVGW